MDIDYDDNESSIGSDVELPDEDDKEFEEKVKKSKKEALTSKMIDKWADDLTKEKPFQAIFEVVQGFKSALNSILPESGNKETYYKVEGSDLFNSMVRLCMKDLFPCLLKLLNLKPSDEVGKKIKLPNEGSNWRKLKVPIKTYIADMLQLIGNIQESEILNALLRHVRLLINFYLCFPKLLKPLVKQLITIWSQSDDKSRVIAFICLHKIISNTHEHNIDHIYKALYLAFIRNSKFTSMNTLPMINFMQRSFVELYTINTELAYKHAFVYIRQQAIHLRNAINLKKKESYQAVYNWQFVHSLNLWSKLLVTDKEAPGLKTLIYPLTQVITGTIKLIPTARYYPLRFHCLSALILLTNSTNVFIPIIPFIIEIFDLTDFNKQHATINAKHQNFSFILKLNKQQLLDKSFKDGLLDNIYDYLILYLQEQSYDIAFPELCLPLIIRLKEFLKKCKNANYCKVIKGLLEKIQENCKFIEDKRKTIQFSIKERKSVDAWIENNRTLGTPLSQWYTRYKTLRERELLMAISEKDNISKNDLPKLQKPTREQREEEKREFDQLFGNLDDESDSDLDFIPKKKMKVENGEAERDSDQDSFEIDDSGDEDDGDDEPMDHENGTE